MTTVNDWLAEPSSNARQCAKGWLISMMLHGLCLLCAMSTVPKLTFVPQQEPFKWDVSLVEAPRQEPAPAHIEAPKPTPPKTQSVPPRPVETYQPVTRQIETRPVVETVQQEIRQVVEAVQPLQEIVKVETNSSVVVAKPESVVVSKPETVVSEKTTEASVVAKTEGTVVEQSAPTAMAVVTSSQSGQMTRRPVVTQPSQSLVAVSASADPALPQRTTGEVQERSASPAPVPIPEERPSLVARTPDPQVAKAETKKPAVRVDHGWLAESLRRRLAELKRYPSIARLNGWEGKVVLRAVIRADGHLAEVKVHRSSGYEALDNAAVEAIRLVCPLHMQQALSTSEVAVYIPIVYSLAG